jgi:SAM-dependent methyltransferase
MKSHLEDFLICPACLPEEISLALVRQEGDDVEVITGLLRCSRCLANYKIVDGLAVLLPQGGELASPARSKYEEPEVVSSYLWSHYADLWSDAEASRAYVHWAEELVPAGGLALDAGCAVGRFTFELGQRHDFAIGFDSSRSLASVARRLLVGKRLDFTTKQEGYMIEGQTIIVPDSWDTSKVEFVVADAQALPFRRNTFACVVSLNLVDKIPRPLLHLQEMSRTAKETGAQFLFSDPFSWSTAYARETDWLGGSRHGAWTGSALENVQAILEGRTGVVSPPWTVQRQGNVRWKIRNHRNHFELIRSQFLRCIR